MIIDRLKYLINQHTTITRIIAALLSGILLALPYNFSQLYLLAWVAFVPLLLALHGTRLRTSYALGLIFGLCFYLSAASWISDFIFHFKNYSPLHTYTLSVVFWLYCAQLPAIMCWLYRWLTAKTNALTLLCFPALATLFYGFFPMLFSVQLGESQSQFLAAIQGVEFTGVYGLDFLIALVNATIATLLLTTSKANSNTAIRYGSYGTIALCLVWLSYGIWATNHWNTAIDEQSTVSIGFIQPNEEPSVEIPDAFPGFSKTFPPELAYSEKLNQHAPELIVIPETRYKGYFRYDHIQSAFKRHTAALATPLIFQDNESATIDDQPRKFNSAVYLDETGEHTETYRKTKRVPFGEYLPLFDEWPPAKRFVTKIFGSFFIDFSAGNDPTVFSTSHLKILPLICYEVMFADFVANNVRAKSEANIIVAISNNGWFGETLQPYQHLNSSLLRSVEMRLPMLHATNNGPSAVFLPNGQRLLQTDYHQSGAFIVNIPVSKITSTTLFSRAPYWFIFLSSLLLALIIIFRIKARM